MKQSNPKHPYQYQSDTFSVLLKLYLFSHVNIKIFQSGSWFKRIYGKYLPNYIVFVPLQNVCYDSTYPASSFSMHKKLIRTKNKIIFFGFLLSLFILEAPPETHTKSDAFFRLLTHSNITELNHKTDSHGHKRKSPPSAFYSSMYCVFDYFVLVTSSSRHESCVTPIHNPSKNFISFFIRNLMICKFWTFFLVEFSSHLSSVLTLQQESSKDESCSVAGYLHQDLCHVSKGKDREDGKGGKEEGNAQEKGK